jgi:hypothetical protein
MIDGKSHKKNPNKTVGGYCCGIICFKICATRKVVKMLGSGCKQGRSSWGVPRDSLLDPQDPYTAWCSIDVRNVTRL